MIGQRIESQLRKPLGAAAFLLLAMALDLVALLTHSPHWAIGSILPWLAALFLLWKKPRYFEAEFTAEGLEVFTPPLFLPYSEMQGLRAPHRPSNPYKKGPRAYPIYVYHAAGVVEIPARVNVPSDEIFGFLYRQLPENGSREVPPILQDYLRRKEEEFGPERVWVFRASTLRGPGQPYPRAMVFWLAALVTGLVWTFLGALFGFRDDHFLAWLGAGIILAYLSGLFCLLLWLRRRRLAGAVRKKLHGSCVIVSPDGLALVQGDLQGRMRWDELLDVKLLAKGANFFQLATGPNGPGVMLKIAGASIIIADVYDRPAFIIYQHLRYYWNLDGAEDFVRDRWQLGPPAEEVLPEPQRTDVTRGEF